MDETLGIVFSGVVPQSRPEDAHDTLGTWRVVGNLVELQWTPADIASFMELAAKSDT